MSDILPVLLNGLGAASPDVDRTGDVARVGLFFDVGLCVCVGLGVFVCVES